MPTMKSKEQLDEERQGVLLPAGDYELLITDFKEDTQDKYMAKADEEGMIPKENIVRFTFEIRGTRDGDPALSRDGEDATGKKLIFTARPDSMGFMRDGTPAKSRQLVANALGKEVNEEFEFEWEDLIGKTIYAEVVEHKTQRGTDTNKIVRFLRPPKRK